MRLPSFKRVAINVARPFCFAAAIALLVADWSGVAQAKFENPEISPASVGSAMTLLAGGLILVRERLRSNRAE